MFQTEFEFTLPKGYLDGVGNLHRKGIMRLAKAVDEIHPLRDPRVKANPAYATIIILSRVITQLGTLEDINPAVIEGLYASDLNHLYHLYRQINDLEDDANETSQNTVQVNSVDYEQSFLPPNSEAQLSSPKLSSQPNPVEVS